MERGRGRLFPAALTAALAFAFASLASPVGGGGGSLSEEVAALAEVVFPEVQQGWVQALLYGFFTGALVLQ